MRTIDAAQVRLTNPWIALAAMLAVSLFNYADRYLLSGIVDLIKADFDVGDGFMGLLMGPSFAVLYTVAAVPIARIADRRSRIAIIAIGCVVWSFFTMLSGLATGPLMLALARVGVGIGEAAFQAPAYSLLADYFPPEKRGRAFAILGVSVYAGQIAGAMAGPAIAAESSWRAAFFAVGAPGLLIALLAFLIVREPPRPALGRGVSSLPMGPLLRSLARSRCYVFATLGMSFGVLAGISFGMWGPTLFSRAYELPLKDAAGAFALYFGIPGVIGMLSFGTIADRLARKSMQWPMALSALSLAAATLATFAVVWTPSFDAAKKLAFVSGIFGGGWSIGVMASLQYLLPERYRVTATAIAIMTFNLIGLVIGPWAAGAISEAIGGDGARSLRLGLSATIMTGLPAAAFLWLGSRSIDKDRAALAAAA